MKPYKTLSFGDGMIPDGLLREHSLKKNVRGELRVTQGELVFVDSEGNRTRATQGARISVAPLAVHHLEETDGAAIEIDFFRVA